MAKMTYGKASCNDYDDMVDLANYVFSHSYDKTDFPTLLPKLYKKDCYVAEHHYIVKEDGKIKAIVGSYPMTFNVCGETLKVGTVGIVSVHPYSRYKGYMKLLMNEAMEEMSINGTDLGCLGGQRQRYEHYGFTPCGTMIDFICDSDNIRYRFRGNFPSGIIFKEVISNEDEGLDLISNMHSRKKAYIERSKDKLFEIMTSWNHRIFGIWIKEKMIGYLSVSHDLGVIHEICIADTLLLAESVGAFLKQFGLNRVKIKILSVDADKIVQFSGLAEDVEIINVCNINVLNYAKVMKAFLKLKNSALPDGQMTVKILNKCNITISVTNNRADVWETNEKPDYTLTHLEAMQLFFSPVSAFSMGVMTGNSFAESLFPIPLFVERNDQA